MRFSMRNELPCPTTRKPVVRLSIAQAMRVGAQLPGWNRLYALIVGAKKQHSSRLYFICPPRNWRKYFDGPFALASQNRFSPWPELVEGPPLLMLMWMWQLLPASVAEIFGMKLRHF